MTAECSTLYTKSVSLAPSLRRHSRRGAEKIRELDDGEECYGMLPSRCDMASAIMNSCYQHKSEPLNIPVWIGKGLSRFHPFPWTLMAIRVREAILSSGMPSN